MTITIIIITYEEHSNNVTAPISTGTATEHSFSQLNLQDKTLTRTSISHYMNMMQSCNFKGDITIFSVFFYRHMLQSGP